MNATEKKIPFPFGRGFFYGIIRQEGDKKTNFTLQQKRYNSTKYTYHIMEKYNAKC